MKKDSYKKIEEMNAFVKKDNANMMKFMKNAKMPSECGKMDAHMTNTGEASKSMGRRLAAEFDKKAFPVK